MKRFLKLNVIALATLLFLGVADAWGLGINKNVALNLTKEGGSCSWDGSKLSWTARTWNLYKFTDWDNSDLSAYDKMVIDVSNATPNRTYRVVITIDGTLYTYTTSGNGKKEINIRNDFKNGNSSIQSISGDPLTKVESIRIGGYSDNGSITINSIKFHKPLAWDAEGKITFSATDFNLGNNVTKDANTFTFSKKNASISLDFDSNNDLATTDIQSVEVNITGTNSDRIKQGFNDTNTKDLSTAQRNKVSFGKFLLFNESGSKRPNITLNTVTFTKKKYVFDVTKDRLYFEDFEGLTQASLHSEAEAPAVNQRPTTDQQGKYFLYGGRGKILKDPTFGQYYQNLADADEYTKSLSENFLRYVFKDSERSANLNAFKKTGAATIGFWVNGQVAVDYELPLERGSMFCIFSNDCFAKADAGNVREKDRPRFMFDLSCNGWVYSYMPNTNAGGTDIGMNYFFYGEKFANSGVENPLESLFGKDNYAHTLDQSQHKFYDDKKWHYVTYVMDNNLTRVKIYLDGVLTGTVNDVTKLPTTDHSECEFSRDNDYIGRTEYLRNIVLGGLTPHGLFYDQQYYSDAALAYDDISMYGRALTQEEIRSIIEQKQYTPKEWHYGDSFKEYNESKGGHEDPHDVSGLGVNGSFDTATGYLSVNGGTLTIPNVPKGYYVRIEYFGSFNATSSADEKLFPYVGVRQEETPAGCKVATYQATKDGVSTYSVNVYEVIKIRSIVITPYQYATLKYGYMEEDELGQYFEPLDKDNKYVAFNVKNEGGKYIYSSEDNKEELGENPALPVLTLNIDGECDEFGDPVYKNISKYVEGKNNPYIKYTSTSPHVAYINKNGEIKLTGIAGNTFIIAELVSDNLYHGSEIIDEFEIRIRKEDNTLRLISDQEVKVNDKFEDLENITMTIGGWKHEGTDTYNIPGVGTVSDSWANAADFADPILGKSGVLDGFDKYSIGTNVARSESLGEFYPKQEFANNITPWNLPCRGAYIKVEPLKAGIVSVYLRQTGNLYDLAKEKGHSRHVTWRPVYVIDETGKPVDFVQPATNGVITYEDNFFVGDKRRAQFIESIEATYNEEISLRQDLINLKNTDYEKFRILIDNWNNAGWRQKVIPTGDGGYMVMSDAVVRYTFNVHPGKTYYLFSNQTQVAISGFNFEQGRLLNTRQGYNYETSPVRNVTRGTKLTWQDNLENQPSIPTSANNDITTVVYERNFAQGKWSSICLPFSMNNRQMREQFGEETAVVLLKTIHEDGKMELIWHVNQDIIAGYPYFILPKGKLKNTNVKNGVITKITADAYFNDRINAEHPLFSVGSNGQTFDWQDVYGGANYNRDYPYVFEGNFSNEELPAGSYVMSNNGALTKIKNAVTAKPFRAYLKYQGSDANHAKPLYTSINWQNDQTTSIDDIIFQNGILVEASDVYGIDGTVVRRNVQNLSNLSKGVYIVNGKKFVVK
jgi:hypothetical protein